MTGDLDLDLDLDLARAAVALPGWRWMPGMLMYCADLDQYQRRTWAGDYEPGGVFVPDYRDAATGGCLLELLGVGWIVTVQADGLWVCRVGCVGVVVATLGEAAIHAAVDAGRWRVDQ